MMLFGAMLEPVKTRSKRIRLVVGRAMPHWPSLGWAVATCYHNRLILRMKGGEFGIKEKLIFTTGGERWLEHALYRWYPTYRATGKRQAVTPADLRLTEGMLVCWLISAMSRCTASRQSNGRRRPIRMTAPRLSLDAAQSLMIQMGRLAYDWDVDVRPGDAGFYKLRIPAARYDDVADWLSGCVDPQFWDRPEIMA